MIASKNKIVRVLSYSFLSFIIYLIAILVNDIKNFDEWVTYMAIISSFHTGLSYIFFRDCKIKIFELPSLFLITTWLFYWAQIFLMGLCKGYTFYKSWNKIQIYPENIYKKTCLIVLISTVFYVIGVLMTCNEDDKQVKSNKQNIYEDTQFKKIGIIVLSISLPFNIYENGMYIASSIRDSYKSIFDLNIPDFISSIGMLSIIGFVALMKGVERRNMSKVMIIAVLTYAIEMLSGNRGPAVCAILTIISFYYCWTSEVKRNIIKYVLYVALLYVFLIFITTLKTFRGYSGKNATIFMEVLQKTMQNNIVFQNLEEFGGTVAVPSITQIYINETHHYLFGITYICALASIFPNIGGLGSKITNYGALVYQLNQHGIYGKYQSIGGSYIAELLLNFGILYFVGSLIIGFAVSHIHNGIKNNKENINLLYYVMPVYTFLHWTRSNFNSCIRGIVWGILLIYLLKKVFPPKKSDM